MTLGSFIIYAGWALMAAGAIYGLYMMSKQSSNSDDMSPSTLGDFRITRASEGEVATLVLGRAKITGNIIWYDNLESKPVKEKVEAGKKTEKVVTGYNYYLDVWVGLATSKNMSIIKTYVQEVEQAVSATNIVFNNGSNGVYSTIPGTYATQLPGLSHVFYEKMFIGENVTTVPTVHYVVECLLNSSEVPVTYRNETNGVNPAAAVYYILRLAGESTHKIDLTSFNAASTYYHDKGYGLNIVFTSKPKAREAIRHILSFVGGAFGQDSEGNWYLHALDEDDSAAATMSYDDGDFLEFSFQRRTYDQMTTDFVGNFIDSDQDYSKRTVSTQNPAIARILGRRVPKSINLKAFRDESTASKRLWELMKENTYPWLEVSCKVPIKYYNLRLGSVVSISHSHYGFSAVEMRVMEIGFGGLEHNEIQLTLRQKTEALFDSNWASAGGTKWVQPDYSPDAAYAFKVFQMPPNHITGTDLVYLVLAARRNTFENGFTLYASATTSNFEVVDFRTQWAQYGTLDDAYAWDTNEIDWVGLTYTPYKEDPIFDTVSFADAMLPTRLALIGSELIGFTEVTLNEDDSITLTGLIRGMLGTQRSSSDYAAGSAIYLFSVNEAVVLRDWLNSTFYVKCCPFSPGGVVDPADVSYVTVNKSTNGQDNVTVMTPAIHWNRGGLVEVYPLLKDGMGAGWLSESELDQERGAALPSNMKIKWKTSAGDTPNTETTWTFNYTDSYLDHFYLWLEVDGYASPTRYFEDNDGNEQWYPMDAHFNKDTSLGRITYGQQFWSYLMDVNVDNLNNTLLKVSGLLDVDVSGLADLSYLVYDEALEKFVATTDADILRGSDVGIDCSVLGIISGSSSYSSGISSYGSVNPDRYQDYDAFDGGASALYPDWITLEHDPWVEDTAWWQIDWQAAGYSESRPCIACIRMQTRYNDYTDRWPKNLRILISDTGAWAGEEIEVFNGQLANVTNIGPTQWTDWTPFDNPVAGRYLRIYIQSVHTYDSGDNWAAVHEWEFRKQLSWEYPEKLMTEAGIVDGTYLDAQLDDGSNLVVTGIDDTPPFSFRIRFINVTVSYVDITVKGFYQGKEVNVCKLQIWNTSLEQFDDVSQATTDFENRSDEMTYLFGSIDTSDYINDADQLVLRIHNETAGDETDVFTLDQIVLSEGTAP